MPAILADPAERERLLHAVAHGEPDWEGVGRDTGWDLVVVGSHTSAPELSGRTIASLADERSVDPAEVVCDLLLADRFTGMIGHGMPKVVAVSILWLFKLAVFAILLYAAFWFGVLLVFAAIAAWIAGRVDADAQSTEWAIGEQEHQQSVFYDPINYNDTPDPRFDDE